MIKPPILKVEIDFTGNCFTPFYLRVILPSVSHLFCPVCSVSLILNKIQSLP
jgi:hypothetical protein